MDVIKRGKKFEENSNFKYIKVEDIGDYDLVSSLKIRPTRMELDRGVGLNQHEGIKYQPGSRSNMEDHRKADEEPWQYRGNYSDKIYDNVNTNGLELRRPMKSNSYTLYETPLVSEERIFMNSHFDLPQEKSSLPHDESNYDNLKADSRLMLKSKSDSNQPDWSLQKFQERLIWPQRNNKRLFYRSFYDNHNNLDTHVRGPGVKDDNVYEFLLEEDIKLPRAKSKTGFKTLFCCGLNRPYSRVKVRAYCFSLTLN